MSGELSRAKRALWLGAVGLVGATAMLTVGGGTAAADPQPGGPADYQGTGTDLDPYTIRRGCSGKNAEHEDGNPQYCTVAFPDTAANLGIMARGHIPAYQCPEDFPYLRNKTFGEQWSIFVPAGIERFRNLWGMDIDVVSGYRDDNRGVPAHRGFIIGGGGQTSTYTNWGNPGNAFRLTLHCTSNSLEASRN
jgi:hypothetical protein